MTSDLSHTTWFKSSYSGDNGSSCVEVADLAGRVGVRDSKDVAMPHLTVPVPCWTAFLHGIRRTR
ncbi:DUF397 domain-containing protein [Streptomyces sp. ACA25]|uniref:DUF397 domain-containing protein n=1 Tax=Streptomyces sp. ACA25 TaxID=3022596 RepID=UPI00230749C4|nr:DUF397 domain-containing protein [Streptomyces sp. ACA25]MDB1086053.1 DUF397 domain-containing protein [Streptomyces sp. ACA25]